MRSTIMALLASAVFIPMGMPAYAGRAVIAAATCVPGDPAIQANRYFVTAGSVKHREGATGLITLYCPVPASVADGGGSFGDMYMTFTAVGDTASVIAQLLRLDHSGNFFPVLDDETAKRALIDSNQVVPGAHHVGGVFKHSFDFDHFIITSASTSTAQIIPLPYFTGSA